MLYESCFVYPSVLINVPCWHSALILADLQTFCGVVDIATLMFPFSCGERMYAVMRYALRAFLKNLEMAVRHEEPAFRSVMELSALFFPFIPFFIWILPVGSKFWCPYFSPATDIALNFCFALSVIRRAWTSYCCSSWNCNGQVR